MVMFRFSSILATVITVGTTVVYGDDGTNTTFRLQILHSSDNESSFQDPNTLEEKVIHYGSLVNGLQSLAADEEIPSLHLTAGDHTIPGPYYLASAEVDEYGNTNGMGDIMIFNAFPNNANGIGNHEFDGGIIDFAEMVSAATYPFLAANLDFSAVDTEPAITVGPDAVDCGEVAGAVAKSCHVTLDNGLTVGLIGRAPADFFNVINDPDTTIPGLDFVGGRNATDNQPLLSAVPMVVSATTRLAAVATMFSILI